VARVIQPVQLARVHLRVQRCLDMRAIPVVQLAKPMGVFTTITILQPHQLLASLAHACELQRRVL
jgi:hypothetical protein